MSTIPNTSASTLRSHHKPVAFYAKSSLALAILLSFSSSLAWSNPQQPANTATSASTQFKLNIAAGPLSQALKQLSQQTHTQIIVATALVEQQKTSALTGQYSVIDALQQLLAGHDLEVNFDGNTAVIRAKSTDGTLLLGAVNVEGSNTAVYSPITGIASNNLSSSSGGNGSRDLTATEGNKSYTRGNISIAGKAPVSTQKILQSVSVIGAQQIEDQKATTLSDSLKFATGIITQQGAGGIDNYHSRGDKIQNISVDGVAAQYSYLIANDFSLYDHVEVLRGSDAFLGGSAIGSAASPGGSINLVRKKPLDHLQTQIDLAAGSWDHYRQSIDITGPLALDGALRARLIATHVDKKEFWRGEQSSKNIADLHFEYDVTPATTISFGGNYAENNGPKWRGAIPRGATGEDLNLPYAFSNITSGVQDQLSIYNVDAAIEHNLNNNWSLRFSANKSHGQTNSLSPSISTYNINPAGHNSLYITPNDERIKDEKSVYNAVILGKVDALQRQHGIEFSIQHSDTKRHEKHYYGEGFSLAYDALTDIDFASLNIPAVDYSQVDQQNTRNKENEAYLKLDLQLLNNLHFLTGPRWVESHYTNADGQSSNDDKFYIPYYGLRYDLNPQWSIYASHSDNFAFQQSLNTQDLSKLEPQRGYTQEIGMKYLSPSQQLSGSIALFQSKYKNVAEFIWDGISIPNPLTGCCWSTNTYEEDKRGIELELSGQFSPHWQSSIGYTYNDNRIRYKELQNPASVDFGYLPKHNLKWSNALQLWGNDWLQRITLGANAIYLSKQDRKQYIYDQNSNTVSINLKQSDYAIADVFARYQINKQWQLQLNINNVFDKQYYSGITDLYSTRYGAPRNFLLSLQAKY
ncbi:TonB-dependent siderophore receptor [Acinetobacter larvae]|uniref:Secretin/TonB short N-terminal domain-containing protein n=1 Tax=Acinetobacter larvae TaxID=1789224 RepID=A0A1B2M0D8_9GAMM|nr:TonB-dependent receptor [Acinetobacter larvae]AOA58621.1 hypothetical protein BFG52_09830 [Acinetobacter larvae]